MHTNSIKIHSERISQTNKELVNNLDYDRTEFPLQEKYFSKIETKKKTFVLMCLVTKIDQSTFQSKNLKTQWICFL